MKFGLEVRAHDVKIQYSTSEISPLHIDGDVTCCPLKYKASGRLDKAIGQAGVYKCSADPEPYINFIEISINSLFNNVTFCLNTLSCIEPCMQTQFPLGARS